MTWVLLWFLYSFVQCDDEKLDTHFVGGKFLKVIKNKDNSYSANLFGSIVCNVLFRKL